MTTDSILKTERLILRPWREEDLEAFAKMNADPRVREFFLSTQTRQESDKTAKILSSEIEKKGWGFWAVSIPNVTDFAGFIGIRDVDFAAPFAPAVEIGWRLAVEHWGKGYATEGALASLNFGFQVVKLDEIVSFAVKDNIRSRHVMEKIGMKHDADGDFDSPFFPEGHPFQRHVLYRIKKDQK